MNRLEKTLRTIFIAGLITAGAGLYKDNKIAKAVGATTSCLSVGIFIEYQCSQIRRNFYKQKKMVNKFCDEYADHLLNNPKDQR